MGTQQAGEWRRADVTTPGADSTAMKHQQAREHGHVAWAPGLQWGFVGKAAAPVEASAAITREWLTRENLRLTSVIRNLEEQVALLEARLASVEAQAGLERQSAEVERQQLEAEMHRREGDASAALEQAEATAATLKMALAASETEKGVLRQRLDEAMARDEEQEAALRRAQADKAKIEEALTAEGLASAEALRKELGDRAKEQQQLRDGVTALRAELETTLSAKQAVGGELVEARAQIQAMHQHLAKVQSDRQAERLEAAHEAERLRDKLEAQLARPPRGAVQIKATPTLIWCKPSYRPVASFEQTQLQGALPHRSIS